MHKTSYEALKKKYSKRPFTLTRSFYIGSHKYSAAWTGDNKSRWEDLDLSIPMIINNSISGYSFIGADVGGFAHNPDSWLLTRWYQVKLYKLQYKLHYYFTLFIVRYILPFLQSTFP